VNVQRPGQLLWGFSAIALMLMGLIAVLLLRVVPGGGPPVARKVLDPPAVVNQISALRELVTVRYGIQKVVAFEEKKVPFGAERMLLFVQSEVSAGVDLKALEEHHVAVLADGVVAVSLPPARITSVVLDDTQTKVWDRSVTWWTPWVAYNQDLERQARLVAKADCEKAAIEMGILDQASRNAKEAIRTLLLQTGASDVKFLDAT
jgi:hypothetical protein